MAKVNKEDFEDYCMTKVEILEEGDEFDSCWGTDFVRLTAEHLDALKEGKVLYWNDGEYSTVVRYGTKDSL